MRGTGPNNRIILADIEEALQAGPVKVAQNVEVKKVDVQAPVKVDMPSGLFKDIEVS